MNYEKMNFYTKKSFAYERAAEIYEEYLEEVKKGKDIKYGDAFKNYYAKKDINGEKRVDEFDNFMDMITEAIEADKKGDDIVAFFRKRAKEEYAKSFEENDGSMTVEEAKESGLYDSIIKSGSSDDDYFGETSAPASIDDPNSYSALMGKGLKH